MVSHTTTGEWQSFETRMRLRRAERLAIRAQAAADAGCIEDARTCLAEARALAPTLLQLDEIERRLAGAASSEDGSTLAPEVAEPSARRGVSIGALVAIAAMVALVAWMFAPRNDRTPESTTASAPPVDRASVTVPPDTDRMPVPSAVFEKETAAAAAAALAIPVTPPDLPVPKPAALQPAPPAQELPAARESTTIVPPPVRRLEPPLRPEDVVRTETAPASMSAPAPSAPVVAAPAPVGVLDLPTIAAAPAPPPAEPAPVEPPQEPAVRAVLNRYASAYTALDADAAQRVWPGVNRPALARAFDSLASQQISLGDCRVDVAGARATASCTGMATWSPKIGGGGRQSEPRNWSFELARDAGGWQIVSARVQNR
jgi:hypothetical protein